MLEELHTASSLLCAALDRYVRACSALDTGLSHNHLINKVVELSDIMDDEMGLVESYKSKLTQARVAVRRARNNQARVPANSLPPEVLTQVFHLLVSDEATNEFYFPRYPETLSHVCSRWRQIALGCPQLWARIDIILSCSRSEGFHDRAAVHASRARQVPLDVYFLDPGDIGKSINSDDESDDDGYASERWAEAMWDHNPDTFHFLASPDSRIRSLRLVVDDRYHPIHTRALEHSLANCLPGSLSELAISVQIPPNNAFFQIKASLEDRDTTELAISEQVLERALSSITVLKLAGMYFPWTSAAYHGLTELRLHCRIDITVSEFTGILKSSPRLHTIRCSFSIVRLLSSGTSALAVALPELEILELDDMPIVNAEYVMRLLNPGPKPLRLSLRGDPTSDMLREFYARSNVQELRTRRDFMTRQRALFSPKAFYLHPQLRVLVMRSWIWSKPLLDGEETPPTQLDTVYMLGCYYHNADLFRATVAHFCPRRLVLWDCHVGNSRGKELLSVFKSALGKDLSRPCFIEYLTDKDPKPVPDWK